MEVTESTKIRLRTRKIKKDHTMTKFYLFLTLVILLLLVAALAPHIVPYDPYAQDLMKALQPPSPEHPLGTDRYGRDMLSRVMMGGQTTIYSALLLVGIM